MPVLSVSPNLQAAGTWAAIVAAAAASIAAFFAFLNWVKSVRGSAPRARLASPTPHQDGTVSTNLVIENRGEADLTLQEIRLECGKFLGEPIDDGMGSISGYKQTEQTSKSLSMLVPSGESKETYVLFHCVNPGVDVSARLKRKGRAFVAVLSVPRTGHTD